MNGKSLAQFLFIGLAAVAVYFFVSAAQDGEARASCMPLCVLAPAYANQNRVAPDFELSDLKGRKVRLSDFRGKTVVLNFWTKTCKPCLEEMSALDDLSEILRASGENAVLLTVSTDASAEDANATLRAVLGKEPRFQTLIDPEANIVNGKFGTKLFPETWLIDPSGTIRVRVDGARDWANPIVMDVIRMVSRPGGACSISFDAGKARGPMRDLCGAEAPSGGE